MIELTENKIIRFFRRKPIRRLIAKTHLRWLQNQFQKYCKIWICAQSNVNMSKLALIKAQIEYYEACFQAWGKFRPEFVFTDKQKEKYEEELKNLRIPFDFSYYNKTFKYKGYTNE